MALVENYDLIRDLMSEALLASKITMKEFGVQMDSIFLIHPEIVELSIQLMVKPISFLTLCQTLL